jgi:glycosyltransferase involved in cell wall biosynthesis
LLRVKIGYLFSRYPVPSQTFCDTEMRALEERGFEIEIYSCSPPATSFRHDATGRPQGPVFYAPPQRGLELARLAAMQRGVWPAGLIAEHEARFGARYEPARRAMHALAFAERLQRRGIDHVHVHFANRATHAALFIHALTGIPFSFTAHAQDFLVDLGSDALLQEMCAQAAFVVTVSDYSRRALVEKCPGAAEKIYRVYNGVALDLWPSPGYIETAPDLSAPALRVFSAGRLIDFKGFDDLIAACGLLRDRGVAFHCEITGDGPAQLSLQSQISELGLDGQVRLLGLLPQAEIRRHLAACDVFALASRVDAKGASDVLPTVILEAMAAGRPVVSTRLAAIPEMVVNGETGVLVPPGDTEALGATLADLAADPPLRERLGHAGRVRLEKCFSARVASGQLASLFSDSPANAREEEARAPRAGGALVLLLDAWPETGDAMPPLARLLEMAPGTRILAFRAGVAKEPMLSLVPTVEFLPDPMVLEAEWRERASEAFRMEAWRGSLGAGVETTDFLLAARRALYLQHSWQAEPPVRHIHAVGPAALFCAWLLIRLEPARQASFILPKDVFRDPLPNSTLRRLAPAFVGGWLPGASRLAAELGSAFHGDDLRPQAQGWNVWQNALGGWAAPADPEPFSPVFPE